MKIYFDESGQTGCILTKKDLLNFQNQPTFALAALVVPSEDDEQELVKKYLQFLDKFGVLGELKGSDLLTKDKNELLKYFVENFINDTNLFVNLCDKRFYLATLLLLGLAGRKYHQKMMISFYEQATVLACQKDEFFIEYLKYIEKPSIEGFRRYLEFLVNFDYIGVSCEDNLVHCLANRILRDSVEFFYDKLMTFGWYENPNITNVINLSALADNLFYTKIALGLRNSDVLYIHDHIREFEDTFRSELGKEGVDIIFEDSKKIIPLQIVDNVVSVVRHLYDRAIAIARENQQWMEQSQWVMSNFSEVIRRLSVENIKFTVPINDWDAALCLADIFNPRCPQTYRNNMIFNLKYMQKMEQIYEALDQNYYSDEEIMDTLRQ